MIGLDTNVLVRYLTQDDLVQSKQAANLLENTIGPDNPGFISLIVMAETVWVLTRAYSVTAQEVLQAVHDLLKCRHLVFQDRSSILQALTNAQEAEAGFVDALIAAVASASEAGCEATYTFDRRAARAGMTVMR